MFEESQFAITAERQTNKRKARQTSPGFSWLTPAPKRLQAHAEAYRAETLNTVTV
jgi:hypothetical protein